MAKRKSLTQKEVATMGGKAVLKKYGKNHYSQMVSERWAKVRAAKAAKIGAK